MNPEEYTEGGGQQTHKHMDITTYRLNRPRGCLSENNYVKLGDLMKETKHPVVIYSVHHNLSFCSHFMAI